MLFLYNSFTDEETDSEWLTYLPKAAQLVSERTRALTKLSLPISKSTFLTIIILFI